LTEDPESVYKLHLDYIKSGAEILTTNTFSIKPNIFRELGLLDELEKYYKLAIELVKKAREESGKNIKIATSVPTLTDSYKYDQVMDKEELNEQYRKLLDLSKMFPTDIVLAETLSTSKEALAIIENYRSDKPLWISFTVSDNGDLRNGEKIEDVIKLLSKKKVNAILVNCSSPEYITKSINKISKLNTNIPFGCYANLFHGIRDDYIQERDHKNDLRKDVSENEYMKYVHEWIRSGATIIGGCCGVGPKYISKIARSLNSPNN